MITLSNIVVVVINVMILFLMIKLRDVSCNCIVDWRNIYIIAYSSIMILLGVVGAIMTAKSKKGGKSKPSSAWMLAGIIVIATMVLNIYALYSYTRDLELSQCNCIKDNNSLLFGFVYYYIRISLMLMLVGLLLVAIAFMMK